MLETGGKLSTKFQVELRKKLSFSSGDMFAGPTFLNIKNGRQKQTRRVFASKSCGYFVVTFCF